METADVVTLRTGRRVGVPWFGAADGFPVLRLHGIAGSGTFEVGVPGGSDLAGASGRGFAELARQDPAAAAGEQRQTVEQWHRDPLTALAAMVSGPDSDVLAHPDWGTDLVRQVADGTRDPEGSAWDRVRVNRPWGFEMAEVGQPVSVWHGACDGLAPVEEGRWLADALPGGRLHLVEAQGHWLLYPCWRQVIDDLLRLVTT